MTDLPTRLRRVAETESSDERADLLREAAVFLSWNAVEDSLPEESGYYLAFNKNGGQDLEWFRDGGTNVKWSQGYITHWMPLPEPPGYGGPST